MKLSHDHRPAFRSSRRRLRDGARGAVLVELALVALLLVTLGAGTYDLGQGWRAGLAVNEAARTGVRTGSALGNDPLADYYALTGSRAALANSGMLDFVERVVIFRSNTVGGEIPASCVSANSTSSPCNIISGDQFRAMTQASFNTTTGCFSAASVRNWCPSSRIDIQLTAEYVGMWIRIRQPREFTFLGTHNIVTRDAVMRIEPSEG